MKRWECCAFDHRPAGVWRIIEERKMVGGTVSRSSTEVGGYWPVPSPRRTGVADLNYIMEVSSGTEDEWLNDVATYCRKDSVPCVKLSDVPSGEWKPDSDSNAMHCAGVTPFFSLSEREGATPAPSCSSRGI